MTYEVQRDIVGYGKNPPHPRWKDNARIAINFVLNIEGSLGGKWMELLKEIAPRVARVAFLYNPAAAPYAEFYLGPFKAAAASLGVEATMAPVPDVPDLETVMGAHARIPNGGLIVMPDAFMNTHRATIVSLATRYRLPAIYAYRLNVKIGGLLSYGHSGAAGGMFHVVEAVHQLRGRADARQVKDAKLAFVHGDGGILSAHCSLVLGAR